MSDYGLKIYNTSGSVQIDQNYMNMGFKQKFTVNSTAAPSSHADKNFVYFSVIYSGEYPIIAVRCTDGSPVFPGALPGTPQGSNCSAGFYTTGTAARVLEVFVFDVLPVGTPTENYGMAVYTAAGRLAFHTGMKPIKLKHALTVGHSTVGSSFALDPSRSFATCFQTPHAYAWAPASDRIRKQGIELVNGGSIGYIREAYTFDILGNPAVDEPGICFILDVTGF